MESEIRISRGSVERLGLVLIWEELEARCGACLHSISRGQRLERGKICEHRGQRTDGEGRESKNTTFLLYWDLEWREEEVWEKVVC